jgi:hypothetical protein
LATTHWSEATNAVAALFLTGTNRVVSESMLAGGNVVRFSKPKP